MISSRYSSISKIRRSHKHAKKNSPPPPPPPPPVTLMGTHGKSGSESRSSKSKGESCSRSRDRKRKLDDSDSSPDRRRERRDNSNRTKTKSRRWSPDSEDSGDSDGSDRGRKRNITEDQIADYLAKKAQKKEKPLATRKSIDKKMHKMMQGKTMVPPPSDGKELKGTTMRPPSKGRTMRPPLSEGKNLKGITMVPPSSPERDYRENLIGQTCLPPWFIRKNSQDGNSDKMLGTFQSELAVQIEYYVIPHKYLLSNDDELKLLQRVVGRCK